MKKSKKKQIICLLAAATMVQGSVYALSSGECLQKALYAEEIEGDLKAAIADYDQVIQDQSASDAHKAQALYRQGMCYVRLNQNAMAVAALTRLSQDFPAQTELIEKAKPVLEKISNFDPAALMPPETLAYLELGDIGGQIETLFEMLKRTPLEDPLAMLAQMDPDALREGPGLILAGLLNPAMKADFMRIRGLAVGLIDVNAEQPEFVAVLHLGDSSMLRGLLMTGLSMVARPGAAVEGVQTYSIENQVAIALDHQVLLAASPVERLPEIIRQYKQVAQNASLASANPAFSSIDQQARHENLVTLWINVDDLFAHDEMDLNIENTAVNVESIDDFMLSASFSTNCVGLEGRLRFKDGEPNMIYDMACTPQLSLDGLKGVPAGAIGFASVKLPDSKSAAMAQLRQLVQSNGIMGLPNELIDSLGQVTLFALPHIEMEHRHEIPARLGAIVQCSDTSLVIPFVEGFKPMLAEQGVQIEVVDGAIIAAMGPDVLPGVKAALAGEKSVLTGGSLSSAVKEYIDAAQKMVVLDGGGLVRVIREDNDYFFSPISSEEHVAELADAYEQLAQKLEGTTLAIHTTELPNELVLNAKLNGIPAASTLLPVVENISQVQSVIDAEWREKEIKERLEKLVPAKAVHTSSAPVLDGDLDAVWSQTPVYSVDKVNSGIHEREQGVPIDGCKLAADFRMLWDEENLYAYIDVTDSTLHRNPDIGWQFSDNVILYIDGTDAKKDWFGETDYEYAFCWDAETPQVREIMHNRMNNVRFRVKTTDKGYVVEAAFPWETLRVPTPASGAMIGIDVQVSDNQEGPERNLMLGWQDDTNGAWQHPLLFGRAELVAEGFEK